MMEVTENEIRLSKSGFSIKSGWGEGKRIIAKCPHSYEEIQKNPKLFEQWINDAEKLVSAYNSVNT